MDSGILRYRFEFQKRTPRRNASGAAENDYEHFAFGRGRLLPTGGAERAELASRAAFATHSLICRYVEGVECSMRVRLPGSGRVFEISEIKLDPTGRRRMTIKLNERVK